MVTIVGAGMSGLLAARMLSQHSPVVVEAQSALPNNHSALLRFRTNAVGKVLGIKFRQVQMIKDVLPYKNPVADALAYSYKNTGVYRSDRSIQAGLQVADRYIAPMDLVARMAKGLNILYNIKIGSVSDHNFHFSGKAPTISTIPMPALMDVLGYENKDLVFETQSGFNIRCFIANCDAYATLYVPSPSVSFSRVSITGNELIIEFSHFSEKHPPQGDKNLYDTVEFAAGMFGIKRTSILEESIEVRTQKYQKIMPVNDAARKEFINWATRNYNVYSLGRFATWKPSLLMDDVVKDIQRIAGWLEEPRSANYETLNHMV